MVDYRSVVHDTLLKEAKVPAQIVKSVKVIPAGCALEQRLLDGTLWFSRFWFECLKTISTPEAHAYLMKSNASRIQKKKSVTQADFEKPLEEQPIVIPDLKDEIKESLKGVGVVSAVAIPASVGAALGAVGLVGGPLGAVAIPIGGFIGMTVGLVLLVKRSV